MFTNIFIFGGQRQNITLGFPAHLNKLELSRAFNHAFKDIIQHPIPYEVVETGPVMENVMEGGDVNVLSFPTPLWHAEDGGRYIDTGSFNVTRDPATQIDIIKSAWSTGLDSSIHPDRKAVGGATNSRAIINAGRSFHWKDRYPKVNLPDPEVWAKAKEKWG